LRTIQNSNRPYAYLTEAVIENQLREAFQGQVAHKDPLNDEERIEKLRDLIAWTEEKNVWWLAFRYYYEQDPRSKIRVKAREEIKKIREEQEEAREVEEEMEL